MQRELTRQAQESTVNFYGRATNASPGPDFTLIGLPDTQYYTGQLNGGSNAMFKAQTNWIVANKSTRNIVYTVDDSGSMDFELGTTANTAWGSAATDAPPARVPVGCTAPVAARAEGTRWPSAASCRRCASAPPPARH